MFFHDQWEDSSNNSLRVVENLQYKVFSRLYKVKEKVWITSVNYCGRPNYPLNPKTRYHSPWTSYTGRITPIDWI